MAIMTQPAGPDPFEFLNLLWGPMGLPGMVTPTLDVSEIDKCIAELKSVETWLGMNLNLLKMTIQGMQSAGADAAKAGAQTGQAGLTGNPFAEAWWNVLQQAQVPQPPDRKEPAKK